MSQTQVSLATALFFFLLFLIQYAPSNATGFSLKLIPITSPESPSYIGNLSESEKIHQLAEMSKTRVRSLSQDNIPRLHVFHLYEVEIQIGNPSITLFLIMDTGSSLTWTQCQPCEHCYYQSSPMYNSLASKSYRPLACEDPLCHDAPFGCQNGRCVYTQRYVGGTTTSGVAARERFGFVGGNIIMAFGCSINRGGPEFTDDRLSGILGLGPRPESLIKQDLGDKIELGKRFSYCLVPFDAEQRATSYLRFGKDIDKYYPGRHFESTPLLGTSGLTNYYLFLRDISVDGRRLGFPPGTFMLQQSGRGGCIIDSGSRYSYIQENAIGTVIRAFETYFSRFRLQRYNGHPYFDLCYHKSRSLNSYPSMTYHFQGADLFVEPKYITHDFTHEGTEIFCVMLISNELGTTIIGAWHQQNKRFIYDLNNGMLQFDPENCEQDHMAV